MNFTGDEIGTIMFYYDFTEPLLHVSKFSKHSCIQKISKFLYVRKHKEYKVPGFLSSCPIGSPDPFTIKGVLLLPLLVPRGETLLLRGKGGGGPIPTKVQTGTLCILKSLYARK